MAKLKYPLSRNRLLRAVGITTFLTLLMAACRKDYYSNNSIPDPVVNLKEVTPLGPDSTWVSLELVGPPDNIIETGVCWTPENRSPFTTDYVYVSEKKGSNGFSIDMQGLPRATFRAYAVTHRKKTIYSDPIHVNVKQHVELKTYREGPEILPTISKVLQLTPVRMAVVSQDAHQSLVTVVDTTLQVQWSRNLPARINVGRTDALQVPGGMIAIENSTASVGDGKEVILTRFTTEGHQLWTTVLGKGADNDYFNAQPMGDSAVRVFLGDKKEGRPDSLVSVVVGLDGRILGRIAAEESELRQERQYPGVLAGTANGDMVYVDSENNNYRRSGRSLENYSGGKWNWTVVMENVNNAIAARMDVLSPDKILLTSTVLLDWRAGNGLSLMVLHPGSKRPLSEVTTFNNRHARHFHDMHPVGVQQSSNGDLLVTCNVVANKLNSPLLLRTDSVGNKRWSYLPVLVPPGNSVSASATFFQADGSMLLVGNHQSKLFIARLVSAK